MLRVWRWFVRWCYGLFRWWQRRPRPFWPSPKTGGPSRRPHAPPKPRWVRDELIRLKALMPEAGCRTIAHRFNRRFAERRQMTVGKTYVAATLHRQQYAVLCLRRTLKHHVPRRVPRNLIWGMALLGRKRGTGYFSLVFSVSLLVSSSPIPRIPRGQLAGHAYHVLNRGHGGAVVFHKATDYAAFLALLETAKAKFPVRVFGFCLMPNHFHLVLQPATVNALSPFMQWWMTSHVRRYHRHYRSTGHVRQGRFKSFPIQQDPPLAHRPSVCLAESRPCATRGVGHAVAVVESAACHLGRYVASATSHRLAAVD